MSAVLFPFLFVPMEDRSTGQAAPTPIPIVTGRAVAKLTAPVTDNACRMPTDADALCKTAVIKMPTTMPTIGLENIVSALTNRSLSLNGETAPLIVCIPSIKIENPSMMSPRLLYASFLMTILKTMPTIATIEEIVAVDKSCAIPSDPSI